MFGLISDMLANDIAIDLGTANTLLFVRLSRGIRRASHPPVTVAQAFGARVRPGLDGRHPADDIPAIRDWQHVDGPWMAND
jgi:hypothetical protein